MNDRDSLKEIALYARMKAQNPRLTNLVNRAIISVLDSFEESEHPRGGNPENTGQFSKTSAANKPLETKNEKHGRTRNPGLAENTGAEKSTHAGTGRVASGASGSGELAVLSGGAANSGTSGASAGGDTPKDTGGDVRPSIIKPVAEVPAEMHEKSLREAIAKDPQKYATVDAHSATELNGSKCFVGESSNADGSQRGTFGAVVRPNGDITGVYNGNGKGAAKDAMIKAIGAGGDRLDAYAVDPDGTPAYLAKNYHKYGFIPVARVPFNAEYAAPGVKPQDIVFYKHNGDSAKTVAANYGKYAPPTKEQYDALPVMSYEDAEKFRDSQIKKAKQ